MQLFTQLYSCLQQIYAKKNMEQGMHMDEKNAPVPMSKLMSYEPELRDSLSCPIRMLNDHYISFKYSTPASVDRVRSSVFCPVCFDDLPVTKRSLFGREI